MTTLNKLPANPSLTQLKNQAKDILKAHKAGDETACLILRHLARFKDESDDKILAVKVGLQEVQHALAISYGSRNWSELVQRIGDKREPVVRFVDKMLINAINADVTELEFETDGNECRVTYLIGENEQVVAEPPNHLGSGIRAELKSRSSDNGVLSLTIAETPEGFFFIPPNSDERNQRTVNFRVTNRSRATFLLARMP